MKKILTLLIITILSCGIGFAGSITFGDLGLTNGTQYLEPFDGGDFTVTFAGGANDGKYYTTGSGIRVYGNGTMTVAAKSGNVTNIEITFANGDSYRPSSNNVVNTGTYNASTCTWTGSASSVVFTRPSSNGHWRVQALSVTISGASSIATPVISGTTPFANSTEVTISCTTTGTTIYYTTNGSDPTNNSTVYSAPFTINSSCTVKAIAYKGTQKSSVASKDFVALTNVSNIAEMNALGDNTQFVMDNDVVCLWHHNSYTYVQDNSGATLIYGSLPSGIEYETRNVIPGGWKGTKTTYNNLPEITNASGFTESETNRSIDATTLNLANITTNDFAKYVVAKNVSITTSGGGNNPPAGETVTFDFNNGLSDLGLTTPEVGTGANLESAITYGGVTMSFTNGGTATRIWNTNGTTTLRVYKNGGSLTFTSSANFTSIVFDGTVVGSTDVGTWTGSSKTWTGNSNSVTLTISSNSTINSIVFTFASSSNAPQRAQTVSGNYTLTDTNGNTLTAYPTKLGYTSVPDDLTKRYDAYGVLDFYDGNAQLLPMGFKDAEGVITSIGDIKATPKAVKYYDARGVVSDKPFDGFNIMVIEYDNGEKTITKMVKR